MPSQRNTATTRARPVQALGTMRPQKGPGQGPAGNPGPEPQTPPDASTCGQRPAAPTDANPKPHPQHSPPVQPTTSPKHTPSEGPPTQTRTATTTAQPERPLGTMRPQANIRTWSHSPQAPAAPCTLTPGNHPPALAQAGLAPLLPNDPPVGPAVRPTEAPSGSPQEPDSDPAHATVPANALRAKTPGHGLPTGVPHPEGGTPAARLAAAEGSGSTRALAGQMGGPPRPAPVPDGQTRAATPIKDDAAAPAAQPAKPQREEPTVDPMEDAGGPPQQKEAPVPAADLNARGPPRAEIPSGVTDQPGNQHASTPANRPPDMAARRSSEAPDTGPPGTGPGGPTLGAGHAADAPPPPAHGAQTAVHAGTAPSTAQAHPSDAGTAGDSTSGEAATQGPPQAHAGSGARATTPDTRKGGSDWGPSPDGHGRDEDSFDAFMESCRCAPQMDPAPTVPPRHAQPRGDHTEPAQGPPREPLTLSRQAHLQRDYAALEARTQDTAATDDGHATAHGADDQTPDKPPRPSAQGSGTRVEMGTNTASGPP